MKTRAKLKEQALKMAGLGWGVTPFDESKDNVVQDPLVKPQTFFLSDGRKEVVTFEFEAATEVETQAKERLLSTIELVKQVH